MPQTPTIGKPYDAAEQTVKHIAQIVKLTRPQVAKAALESAYKRAQETACDWDITMMWLLGIDNNHRFLSGPRKGQHRPNVALVTL